MMRKIGWTLVRRSAFAAKSDGFNFDGMVVSPLTLNLFDCNFAVF